MTIWEVPCALCDHDFDDHQPEADSQEIQYSCGHLRAGRDKWHDTRVYSPDGWQCRCRGFESPADLVRRPGLRA